jgi:hypothetical protein
MRAENSSITSDTQLVLWIASVNAFLTALSAKSIRPLTTGIVACPSLQPALKDSPMYILRALAFLFLAHAVLAQQPTPISVVVEALRQSFGVETEPHPLTARELLSRVRFPQHLH